MSFSVLMSVYNKENPCFLDQSIKSVFSQTLLPDELVVIKDGLLTKELDAVIEKYIENYNIKIYQFQNNVKLGLALRKGVELCSNSIIARMDSDDIALQDRFEVEYNYLLSHPDISVVGSYIQEFYEEKQLGIKKMPISNNEIIQYSKLRNPMNHMTVMFRKEAVIASGNYHHFPLLEDYYLWSRMLVKGYKFNNIPKVLVMARTGMNMYNRRGGLHYFKNHLNLRNKQYKIGHLNLLEYVRAVIVSFAFTMCPSKIKQILYTKLLRKSEEEVSM